MFTRRVRHRNTLNAHMMSIQPLMGAGTATHPKSCQYTLLIHHLNAHMMSIQPLMGAGKIRRSYTLSIHPVNTVHQYILPVFSIDVLYLYLPSTSPINPPYQHPLLIHPINIPYQYALTDTINIFD